MQKDILATLTRLSDGQLLAQIRTLVSRDHDVTAEIVAHLAELETRDVYLREGYPSLFVYCRDAFGLSEWEAFNRIEVARAARRFPVILELLAEGSVNLTAVKLLNPHLTQENHRDVLEAARGRKKAEIEELVAKLSPKADVSPSVRRIPQRVAAPPCSTASLSSPPPCSTTDDPSVSSPPSCSAADDRSLSSALPSGTPGAPFVAPSGAPFVAPAGVGSISASGASTTCPTAPVVAAAVTPLSPGRYKLQVTIGAETVEKIRLARDMLGHAIPSGDDAEILDRAFTALLADLSKKKFTDTPAMRRSAGSSNQPDLSRNPSGQVLNASNPAITWAAPSPPAAVRKRASRQPSAAVKRAVWVRDLGRCAFVGTGGHRCNERRFVEFHHVDPYVLGGEATVDGIQLRCRRHNDYEGRLYFGERRRGPRRRELVPEQVDLSASDSTLQPRFDGLQGDG